MIVTYSSSVTFILLLLLLSLTLSLSLSLLLLLVRLFYPFCVTPTFFVFSVLHQENVAIHFLYQVQLFMFYFFCFLIYFTFLATN